MACTRPPASASCCASCLGCFSLAQLQAVPSPSRAPLTGRLLQEAFPDWHLHLSFGAMAACIFHFAFSGVGCLGCRGVSRGLVRSLAVSEPRFDRLMTESMSKRGHGRRGPPALQLCLLPSRGGWTRGWGRATWPGSVHPPLPGPEACLQAGGAPGQVSHLCFILCKRNIRRTHVMGRPTWWGLR